MVAVSDRDLIMAVKEGDVSSFEVFVRRYQQKLRSIARFYVRDPHITEDVVQESFIRFYKNIDKIDLAKSISSFLFVITKHEAISELRAKKRIVSLDEAVDMQSSDSPESDLIVKDNKKRIEEAMKSLNPKYRKVLSLYYFEQVSYQEMSKLLHTPINTIRTHLKRAKNLLSKLLIYEEF